MTASLYQSGSRFVSLDTCAMRLTFDAQRAPRNHAISQRPSRSLSIPKLRLATKALGAEPKCYLAPTALKPPRRALINVHVVPRKCMLRLETGGRSHVRRLRDHIASPRPNALFPFLQF